MQIDDIQEGEYAHAESVLTDAQIRIGASAEAAGNIHATGCIRPKVSAYLKRVKGQLQVAPAERSLDGTCYERPWESDWILLSQEEKERLSAADIIVVRVI